MGRKFFRLSCEQSMKTQQMNLRIQKTLTKNAVVIGNADLKWECQLRMIKVSAGFHTSDMRSDLQLWADHELGLNSDKSY